MQDHNFINPPEQKFSPRQAGGFYTSSYENSALSTASNGKTDCEHLNIKKRENIKGVSSRPAERQVLIVK